ncbi:hypothetical protein ACFL5M_01060 [Candidatus Neomarinimicrobiota bacterium]
MGQLQKSIREGGFPMIDVSYDAEIAYEPCIHPMNLGAFREANEGKRSEPTPSAIFSRTDVIVYPGLGGPHSLYLRQRG